MKKVLLSMLVLGLLVPCADARLSRKSRARIAEKRAEAAINRSKVLEGKLQEAKEWSIDLMAEVTEKVGKAEGRAEEAEKMLDKCLANLEEVTKNRCKNCSRPITRKPTPTPTVRPSEVPQIVEPVVEVEDNIAEKVIAEENI